MKTADNLLPKLADGEVLKAGQGRVAFETGTSRWTLSYDSDGLDGIGGRFRQLRLDRNAGTSTQPLDVRGAVTAQRLTGLLESIKLVEVDHVRQVAQLRSASPAVRGTARQYYELQIQGADSITLQRYQFDSGAGARQAIPFSLTYDALAKLVDDLTSD